MTKFSSNRPVKSTLTADQSLVKPAQSINNEYWYKKLMQRSGGSQINQTPPQMGCLTRSWHEDTNRNKKINVKMKSVMTEVQ